MPEVIPNERKSIILRGISKREGRLNTFFWNLATNIGISGYRRQSEERKCEHAEK